MTAAPKLDHPTLPLVKERFAETKFLATEFRGQTTLVVPAGWTLDANAYGDLVATTDLAALEDLQASSVSNAIQRQVVWNRL